MTPAQLDLFGPPPMARTRRMSRRSDPPTSNLAAESVDLTARKAEVVDAMRLIVTACTASEIHAKVREYGSRMDVGSVRSRLNQLKDDGRVEKVGFRLVPKPTGSGRPETTWRLL